MYMSCIFIYKAVAYRKASFAVALRLLLLRYNFREIEFKM